MAGAPVAAPALLQLRSGRGRLALAATVLASSTAMLDATIVNVALPHIGRDLDVGVTGLQWVVSGYLLTLASLILLGGALGDRYGRRRVFTIGAVWFAVASLVCAIAPSAPILVGGRMLQGIGGALLTPTSLALAQASFVRGRTVPPRSARGRGSVGSPVRSGRSSAVGWSTAPGGVGRSCSTSRCSGWRVVAVACGAREPRRTTRLTRTSTGSARPSRRSRSPA